MAIEVGITSNSSLAKKDLEQLNKSVQSISGSVNKATDGFKQLAISITSAIASFGLVKTLAEMSDQLSNMETKLKVVTKNTDDFYRALKNVRNIAIDTYSSLDGVATLYAKIALNSEELGASQRQIGIVTKNITRSLAASGASASEATSAITQLGQALASGRLQGDELRSILESAPILAQQIAKGVGATIGEMRKLGEEGRLTSKTVFEAILNQTEEIDRLSSNINVTFGRAFTNLRTAGTIAFDSIIKFLSGSGAGDQNSGLAFQINQIALKIIEVTSDLDQAFIDIRVKLIIFTGELGRLFDKLPEKIGGSFGKAIRIAEEKIGEFKSKVVDIFEKTTNIRLSGFKFTFDPKSLDVSRFIPKLDLALENIKSFVNKANAYFAWLYDKVIGNSWIPDLVLETIAWLKKLLDTPIRYVKEFTVKIEDMIFSVYNRLSKSQLIETPMNKVRQLVNDTKELIRLQGRVKDPNSKERAASTGIISPVTQLNLTASIISAITTGLLVAWKTKNVVLAATATVATALITGFGSIISNLIPMFAVIGLSLFTVFGSTASKVIAGLGTLLFTIGFVKLPKTGEIQTVVGEVIKAFIDGINTVARALFGTGLFGDKGFGGSLLLMAKLALLFEKGRDLVKTGAVGVAKLPYKAADATSDLAERSLLNYGIKKLEKPLKKNNELAEKTVNFAKSQKDLLQQSLSKATKVGGGTIGATGVADINRAINEKNFTALNQIRSTLDQSGKQQLKAYQSSISSVKIAEKSLETLKEKSKPAQAMLDNAVAQRDRISARIAENRENFRRNATQGAGVVGGIFGGLYGMELGSRIADAMGNSYSVWQKIGVQIGLALGGQMLGALAGQFAARIALGFLSFAISPLGAALIGAAGVVALILSAAIPSKMPDVVNMLRQSIEGAFNAAVEVITNKFKEAAKEFTNPDQSWVDTLKNIAQGWVKDLVTVGPFWVRAIHSVLSRLPGFEKLGLTKEDEELLEPVNKLLEETKATRAQFLKSNSDSDLSKWLAKSAEADAAIAKLDPFLQSFVKRDNLAGSRFKGDQLDRQIGLLEEITKDKVKSISDTVTNNQNLPGMAIPGQSFFRLFLDGPLANIGEKIAEAVRKFNESGAGKPNPITSNSVIEQLYKGLVPPGIRGNADKLNEFLKNLVKGEYNEKIKEFFGKLNPISSAQAGTLTPEIKMNQYAQSLPEDRRFTAFTEVIAEMEGTLTNGFNTLVGVNKRFEDFSKHPRQYMPFEQKDGKTNSSTAAGLYQIIQKTYDRFASAAGVTDFSPESQTKILAKLLDAYGVKDLVQQGNFAEAMKILGEKQQFASFPSAPASMNQGKKTIEQATQAVVNAVEKTKEGTTQLDKAGIASKFGAVIDSAKKTVKDGADYILQEALKPFGIESNNLTDALKELAKRALETDIGKSVQSAINKALELFNRAKESASQERQAQENVGSHAEWDVLPPVVPKLPDGSYINSYWLMPLSERIEAFATDTEDSVRIINEELARFFLPAIDSQTIRDNAGIADQIIKNLDSIVKLNAELKNSKNIASVSFINDTIRDIVEQNRKLAAQLRTEKEPVGNQLAAGSKEAGEDLAKNTLSSLTSGFSSLLKGGGSLKEFGKSVFDSFTGKVVDTFAQSLMQTLFSSSGIEKAIKEIGANVFNIGSVGGSTVGGAAADAVNSMKPVDTKAIEEGLSAAGISLEDLAPSKSGIGQSVKTVFDEAAESAVESISAFGETISSAFDGLFKDIDWGKIIANIGSFFGFASGGYIKGKGTGTSDSNLIRVSTGEFIMNAAATKQYRPFLEAINSGRDIGAFSTGGYIGADSYASIGKAAVVNNMQSSRKQELNLTISGDISRQTRTEVMRMIPELAAGINSYNHELNYKGN